MGVNGHVAKRDETEKKAGSDPVPKEFGACRLLIAEDEHMVALGLKEGVTDLGHEVVAVARDGEEVLELARQHQPDLVLMDIRMPKKTGIEAAAEVYEKLGIPSIIISAYSDPEHLSEVHSHGQHAGVFGYLLKPVGRESLRVAIGVAQQRIAVDDFKTGRITQLERNLSHRRMVEQAKWKLVEKLGVTEATAHDRLQRVARNRRQQLADVARAVLEENDMLGLDSPDGTK